MKRKLASTLLLSLFMVAMLCLCSASADDLPTLAPWTDNALVQIVTPKNNAVIESGKFKLQVAFKPTASYAYDMYSPVRIEVLEHGALVFATDEKLTNDDALAAAVAQSSILDLYTLDIDTPSEYTLRVKVPGSDEWSSIGFTIQSSNPDEPYFPAFLPEEMNPGYHIQLDQSAFTLDLNGENVARINFEITTPSNPATNYYVDYCEDRTNSIIKFNDMGDDYIEYIGVGIGSTRLHVYVWVTGANGGRFDHHVVTFDVIDSSAPTPTPEAPAATPVPEVPAVTPVPEAPTETPAPEVSPEPTETPADETCPIAIAASKTVFPGKSITLSPTQSGVNNPTFSFASSDKKIVKVTGKGKVTGLKSGKATVTIKSSHGETAKVKITVKSVKIKLNKTKVSVVRGKTFQLTASQSGTQGAKYTFKSSDKKIASVDKKGKIKGIKKGSCTITVTSSFGETAKVKVTVK